MSNQLILMVLDEIKGNTEEIYIRIAYLMIQMVFKMN